MTKLVLLLCVAVSCVLGTPNHPRATPPKPCCMLDQWDGMMAEVGTYVYDTHAGTYRGFQYVIFTEGNTCTKSPLTGTMPPNCIPDDAKFGGAFYMGGPDYRLPCHRWLYTSNGRNVSLTVTQQDCYPVLETEYSAMPKGGQMASSAFAYVHSGIHDPTVFNIPSFCNKVSKEHPHHQLQGPHLHALNRLRI
ncbi:mammalian ependymin-related protein 1-like [Lingula anatina]|uniref:Mammalian ependymin-related protein 1-like n=1 Tax=Lingula anatina TaxID=7574 RepID=A0A1S3JMU9_LINAN|nr:mammalian ependymin-related protein 1-like [Lingula anatina]|eukprot:XP_013411471.1 mammalian ependymin-related protein 1-like [Lingula anatina]